MHNVRSNSTRVRISVSGVVQGVGFRPFVYTLACRHSLVGYVCNTDGIVEIEVQGKDASVREFIDQLQSQAPPLAQIERVFSEPAAVLYNSETEFAIRESASSGSIQQRFVPPDTATCEDCLTELFDKKDRRYRYPFVNCTNCGPRFTIISSLPYDRPSTTMAAFQMCSLCRQEYLDPTNRRFHAQPNACSQCGPSLSFIDSERQETYRCDDALRSTIEQLSQGRIIAVKGLGGFHLICDATSISALLQLRQRKLRARKPFAVMMNMDMVRKYCHCSSDESEELQSTGRPIVLLRKRRGCSLPDELAPGLDVLGVMLPYTPLHHLLMADYDRPLVATSANVCEEPIAIDNDEAIVRLESIADCFLLHDRRIQSRYDDSVVRLIGKSRAILRRSRGLAPLPIKLPFQTTSDALACGAHLKNTFCFIRKDQAFVSQHIGDLENVETHVHFEQSLDSYTRLFGFTPSIVAHDSHPDYLSTAFAQRFAAERQLRIFDVQHHHAHVVSCMIENGLTQPVIGVSFDGLGYGLDGTIWGGEFLLAKLTDFQRLAFFEPIAMPGSSLAIKQPWRMALSYVYSGASSGSESLVRFADVMAGQFGQPAVDLVRKQIGKGFNSPLTSSCGRLFDAMSALLGICYKADYEGQAAMELEAMANQAASGLDFDPKASYSFEVIGDVPPYIIRAGQILETAYGQFLNAVPVSVVAARFHHTIAQTVLAVCQKVRLLTGVETVCLSGGVFQNALLSRLTRDFLAVAGFKVFFPCQLPANDGGLSLGQAVIALARAGAISVDEQ